MSEINEQANFLERALKLAFEAHEGQVRRDSPEPYIIHPVRVFVIISKFTDDIEIRAAALLHDGPEDTSLTLRRVRKEFGPRVANLVKELTSRKKDIKALVPKYKTYHKAKAVYLTRKIDGMTPPAKLIKLGDRLDNVSGLRNANAKFREQYIQETRDILHNVNRKLFDPDHELLYAKIMVSMVKVCRP